jgi:hypothetical protein
MPPGPTIPPLAPTLCRLCRRPIPRAAQKCPHCGARQAWRRRERAVGPRGGWRAVACATGLAALVALAAIGLVILRDVKTPLTSAEGQLEPAAPSATECAELVGELRKAVGTITPELRDRFRQCLERR